MKEIKNIKKAIDSYKGRLQASMLGMSLFIFFAIIFAIASLIYLPQVWWLSLMFFGFAFLTIILAIFYIKFTKKEIKAMEEELAEVEKQQALNEQNIDISH